MRGGYAELSETSQAEQLRQAALLKRVDAEKRARRIVVPTDDKEVRTMLRKLGHAVRLFGESPADVRDRLRQLLARIEIEGEERDVVAALLSKEPERKREKQDHGEVYTAAPENLVVARRFIAEYSFERAQRRLGAQKRRRDAPEASETAAGRLYADLAKLTLSQSQFADERPVARVRCSPVAPVVATGAWSGVCKVWDAQTCELRKEYRCGDDRVTGLAWSPTQWCLAAGCADASAYLWTESQQQKFEGHTRRLGHVDFHPSGRFLGTTSFDHTWRLWDCETGAQVLLQDGHGKEVYSLSFQVDGSVVATGDFAGIIHIWDLRSGNKVHTFLGHSKKVLAADFAPDGYVLATASDDHTVRVWDLRRRVCDYVLPAHANLVSDVKWDPSTGEALATSSFDGAVVVWCARDFSPLATLTAHDGKAMSLDFVRHGFTTPALVTAGFDRTFKVWVPP